MHIRPYHSRGMPQYRVKYHDVNANKSAPITNTERLSNKEIIFIYSNNNKRNLNKKIKWNYNNMKVASHLTEKISN